MGKIHLAFEELSALIDGELGHRDEQAAREHLEYCSVCSAELTAMGSLDGALKAAPPIACAASADLRSALLDRELTPAEAQIALAHVADCASCSTEQLAWTAAGAALRAMPAALPSTRVDAAMRDLLRGPARRGGRPRTLVPGAGLRVAAAMAVVVAVIVGLLPSAAGPDQAVVTPQDGKAVFVASLQQTVLHSKSNTLYVLRSAEGAVDAVNATTYAQVARISVGGRPSALALNSTTDTVVVLDATAKTVTEIDANTNRIVASTQVEVAGTPTSVQVDPNNGNVIIASVIAPGGGSTGGPLPSPTSGTSTGQVSIFDPATKRIDQVKSFDVAPRLVVPDPTGRVALLVSPESTTLVDASYNRIATLPGGISAAFDMKRDWFAILSKDGSDLSLTFVGREAPGALRLEGDPESIVALPDGGFGILVAKNDIGRIYVVDGNGRATGFLNVEMSGSDLEYDPASRRFTVTREGLVASVQIPVPVAVAPSPTQPIAASPSAQPSPAPGATNEPSATAPAGSAQPSVSPEPIASLLPLPTQLPQREVVAVPDDLTDMGGGLYRLLVPLGHAPVLTAKSETHIWFVDEQNGLDALDLETASVFRIAQFPVGTQIRALAVGPDFVYAADAISGRLYVLDLKTEILSSRPLPVKDVSAMTVTSGGVLWLAMPDSTQLLSLTPLSRRLEAADIGVRGVIALQGGSGDKLWFSTLTGLGYYDRSSRRVTQLPWRWGTPHILLAGPRNTLWVGTARGEILAVRGESVSLEALIGRPVTALTLDPTGRPWYLAPDLGTRTFSYRTVDPFRNEVPVSGPALDFALNSQWRVWVVDPSGGFFLRIEAPR